MEKRYWLGLDWARWLASWAVVAIHTNAAQDWGAGTPLSVALQVVFRWAVPTFLLISLFLFLQRERTARELAGTVGKYLTFALVWSGLFYVVVAGGPFAFLHEVAGAFRGLLDTPWVSGGKIVSAFETVYYFFVDLGLLTVLAWACRRWNTPGLVVLWAALVAFQAAIKLLAPAEARPLLLPLEFLPLAPAAVLLQRGVSANRATVALGLGLGAAGLVVLAFEAWVLWSGRPGELTDYTRLSDTLWTGSFLVLLTHAHWSPRPVAWFSRQSLPLYLLHPCLFALAGAVSGMLKPHLGALGQVAGRSLDFVALLLTTYTAAVLIALVFRITGVTTARPSRS